jgi:RNA polymerase sigma factor (sigma-70 family)
VATSQVNEVIQHLRRVLGDGAELTDGQLLEDYLSRRDEAALAALVRRHGPMVWGTCRRVLHNYHDAEDAFQATFLVLVRKAASIASRELVANWLYGVAHQTALKARATAAKRKERERQVTEMPEPAVPRPDPGRDLQSLLDEELSRLPDKYRAVIVLCDLEGKTRKETAQQLDCPEGTVAGRLARARIMLAKRLTQRGVAVSGGVLAAMLLQQGVSAGVPESVLSSTIRAASCFSAGQVAATEAISVQVTALTEGVLKAMLMSKLVMKSILAFVVAIAVGVGIYAGTGQPATPAKAEEKKAAGKPAQEEKVAQWDDPLPAGSTMRLGTSRFRQGVSIVSMAVSADGKKAFVCNGTRFFGSIRAFDLTSGRALFTLKNVEAGAIALSPDGWTLVTKQELHLHIRDSRTGQELRTIDSPKKDQWSDVLVFTPDGKAIATTSAGKVFHLIDFESGKWIRDFSHDNPESVLGNGFLSVLGIAFSPDGKRMANGSFDNEKGNYFARLWDVKTGKELRRFMHGKRSYGIPSLAFSPDAKTLATRSHDGRLRLFDVDTGKERKTFPTNGGGRKPGSVAFAPDGKTVAAAGDSIRLYDATTGEERLRIDRSAHHLHFREQGKTLTAVVGGAIYRWDTATGKPLTPTSAGDSIVEQILVTPDGRRIVTRGQEGDAHVWDGVTGKHLRALQASWQRDVALSPDGRYLAWSVGSDGVNLRLYDVVADRFVERFPAFKGGDQDLTFIAGDKTLVTIDRQDAMVRLWNVETGKEQRSFRAGTAAEKKQTNRIQRAVVSPDGTTLAVAYPANTGGVERLSLVPPPDVIRLWDVASGKELRQLNGHSSQVRDVAFSPDGHLLVTAGEIWNVATGKLVMALPNCLPFTAFSVDGRSLASASFDGTIRIWETATWTERTHFRGYHERTTALAFTPAGQILYGGLDTTVLARDVRPPRVAVSVPLERAWNDLATKEAGKSFQSEGRFLATPADTVKFFAEKVKPVTALDPKRIRRLLADLGSDEFTVREAASQALHGLDEQAIPYLEATLKSAVSLEVRLRVQRILEQKQETAITTEQLRQIRTVTVLERIGDGASKHLLKKWASGPVGALLTREASAALKRLETVSKLD